MSEDVRFREFDARASDYARYRPSYPREVLRFLPSPPAGGAPLAVADIGSGTGIMSRVLLDGGHVVYAVEPNGEMRASAEVLLSSAANYHSIDGSAEATNLPAGSVDAVVCAQAFHFFDNDRTRSEFDRILRGPAAIVLCWNVVSTEASYFEHYLDLLRKYASPGQRIGPSEFVERQDLKTFFRDGFSHHQIAHGARYDLDQLLGHFFSYSYLPSRTDGRAADMRRDIQQMFEAYRSDRAFEMQYKLEVFCSGPKEPRLEPDPRGDPTNPPG